MNAAVRRAFETLRYEDERWPLWRWDKNLRYIAKSLAHRPTAPTADDARHHARMAVHLAGRSWCAPERPGERTLRIAAVGDLMWIRSGWADALSAGVAASLERVDLAFGNLETPVVASRPVPRLVYETLHYNAPPSYLDAWRPPRAGTARVLSVCNNHAIDQGETGLSSTRAAVHERGIACLGGTTAGDEVAAIEAAGLRVAALATTFGINHLPDNDPARAPAGVPVIRFGDPRQEPPWEALAGKLAAARAGADLVVVVPHWGHEYEYWPDATMRRHAHRLVELGADLILGSSPHVLQPVEVVSVDGGDPACPVQLGTGGAPRCALVAYSLGNFASIMPTLACRTGVVLAIDLRHAPGRRPRLAGARVTPTATGRGLGGGWLDARVVLAAELGDAARAAAHRREAARPLWPLLEEDA